MECIRVLKNVNSLHHYEKKKLGFIYLILKKKKHYSKDTFKQLDLHQ